MGERYHHGNLRAELVRVSLDLIAEQGLRGFSVAEVARRAEVSPGAPYRHFPERGSLLAAVATAVAGQLADRVRNAAEGLADPVDALAAGCGAYTEYLIERQAGINVIYADGLQGGEHEQLHEQTRRLTDQFLMLCLTVSDHPASALELMEQLFTQAHGYGMFWLEGVFARHGYSAEQVVRKSVAAARVVIEGHRYTTRG
ncbi:DNA-binding transcriptional regulator, AcrR family [Prauserella marina]|uniref:DNA-binding transcriptional regulator, AcrR family n=1 Tax=Prauserella marina TaxID=530584 RepID=A0A1G6ZBR3_9PSEU|nr:TetR/AcrR family transcriptional regulator [Prauserella marina]PWV70985.1 TetR family transcriptional regulator [Prauserella marina]SDE00184.1 DNA-binding transcriptional regulator, AcrR family [Prauserella marina]